MDAQLHEDFVLCFREYKDRERWVGFCLVFFFVFMTCLSHVLLNAEENQLHEASAK